MQAPASSPDCPFGCRPTVDRYTARVSSPAVERVLAAAEVWRAGEESAVRPTPVGRRSPAERAAAARARPRFTIGWEAAYPFCAAVCSTVVGLEFCRRCPESLVTSVLGSHRTGGSSCPAGVRLLAFPVPPVKRRPDAVVVLRVAPPDPAKAAKVATVTRVAATSLRRAARETPRSRGADVLRAARTLRSAAGRLDWQVTERERSADRNRAASATLAQFIVATEELQALYRSAVQQRGELRRARDTADRFARDAVRAREGERARIAHLIHNTVAQSMVSAVRFLDAGVSESEGSRSRRTAPDGRRTADRGGGRGAGQGGSAPGSGNLSLAQERLRAAIHELRAILDEFVPAGLEQGLDQAIRFRHSDILEDAGLSGSVAGNLPRLEPWVEQVVYGMVSEAMTNAARHAGGRSITVDCSTVRDRIVVVVRDDGIGISARGVGEVAPRRRGVGGLGIAGLMRQARWLGGRVSVRERAGGGTAVRISVPLSRHLAKRSGTAEDLRLETPS
jgi:signal transduction histidine kinase